MIDADRFYSNGDALSQDSVPVNARLMPGQIVVPRHLLEQHAHLKELLAEAFQEQGASIRSFTVGSDAAPRDPVTGTVSFENESACGAGSGRNTILTGMVRNKGGLCHAGND